MPLEIDEGQGEPFESSKGGRGGGSYFGGPGPGRGAGAMGAGGGAGSGGSYRPGSLFGMRRRWPMGGFPGAPGGAMGPGGGFATWDGMGGGGAAPVMAGGFGRSAMPLGAGNPGASYQPVSQYGGMEGGGGGGFPPDMMKSLFRGGAGGFFRRPPPQPSPSFDPSDPYGAFTGNPDPGFMGEFHRGFGKFGEAGTYGPEGNQRLFDQIRQQLISGQGDTERRGQLANQMDFSGDPSRYGFASLKGALQGGSDLSRGLGDASLQFGMRQDQFGKDLYQKWLDYQLGRAQSLQRGLPGQQQQGGSGLGGLLGGIGGGIAGSFFGNPLYGASIGSGIGGRF